MQFLIYACATEASRQEARQKSYPNPNEHGNLQLFFSVLVSRLARPAGYRMQVLL